MERTGRSEDIEKLAIQVFGNEEKAVYWLHKPMKQLSGKSPIEAAEQELGEQIVKDLLYDLDNGYLP